MRARCVLTRIATSFSAIDCRVGLVPIFWISNYLYYLLIYRNNVLYRLEGKNIYNEGHAGAVVVDSIFIRGNKLLRFSIRTKMGVDFYSTCNVFSNDIKWRMDSLDTRLSQPTLLYDNFRVVA